MEKTGLLARLKGHFLLIRPVQLLWLDVFVGFASYAVIVQEVPSLHFLLFILCSLLADAGACTLNDIGDVDSDRLSSESSRSKRPMVTGTVPLKAAKAQAIVLYLLGLGLALYLDIYVFIFALSLVILSHQYSMKPLKMDGRPIISQLFWVAFAVIYFCAINAYFIRYNDVPWENIRNGLYFLGVMVLFLAVAETLAKDLRDMENDRDSGKRTSTVFLGHKISSAASFVLSTIGISLWAYPHFMVYDSSLPLHAGVLTVTLGWIFLSGFLCFSIFKEYSKKRYKQLHIGYLLTLTLILLLTYIGGVN
jgi:4-hydroxybenzoate polyprenyltransferase